MNREETIDALLLLLDSSSDSSNEDSNSTTSSSSSWSSFEDDEVENNSFLSQIKKYTDEEFRKQFRLTRKAAKFVLDKYESSGIVPKKQRGGRELIGVETQIYVFLWYVANKVSFREVGNMFGVSKTVAWEIVKRVSSWISSISKEFIHWPVGADLQENTQKFAAMSNIPGVVGAIGVTHILIKAPKDNQLSYSNRQQNFSLATQCVVDANTKFIDVHCAEPGSLDESQLLMRSDLYREAIRNMSNAFPSNTFLLGSSAYPCLKWLLTPFSENGCLDGLQQSFNTMHETARTVLRNAFGHLKTTFKRIQQFDDTIDLNMCKNIIVSACVLHNVCIDSNESEVTFENENVTNEDINEYGNFSSFPIEDGHKRRDNLIQCLVENGILWRTGMES